MGLGIDFKRAWEVKEIFQNQIVRMVASFCKLTMKTHGVVPSTQATSMVYTFARCFSKCGGFRELCLAQKEHCTVCVYQIEEISIVLRKDLGIAVFPRILHQPGLSNPSFDLLPCPRDWNPDTLPMSPRCCEVSLVYFLGCYCPSHCQNATQLIKRLLFM